GGRAVRPPPGGAIRAAEVPAVGGAPARGTPAVRLRRGGYASAGAGAGLPADRRPRGWLGGGRDGAPDPAYAPRGRPHRDGAHQGHLHRLQPGRATPPRASRLLLSWRRLLPPPPWPQPGVADT